MGRLGVVLVGVGLLASASGGEPICSFETEADLKIVRPSGPAAERVREHATHGTWALRCLFRGSKTDTWPGLSFRPRDTNLARHQILAFDVWNASKETVHLSWRIDDGKGTKIFGGQRLDPRRHTTAEIYIKGLETKLDSTNIVHVYPYISKPRKDVLLYFDNFRYTQISLQFTPLIYEETAPAATVSAGDRKRGYVLFARHWLDVVFANSRPRPGETQPSLRAFATPGEHEPLTLSVHALGELRGASVAVSDLVSPHTPRRIPSSAITVYPVRCLNKRVTYSSKEYVKALPVLLERRAKVDVAAGECKRFWLDVHVPPHTPPGIYKGSATLQAAGRASRSVPVWIRVLPFGLVEPTDMIWGDYYTGPKLAKTEAEKRAFLERDLRDMRRQGMTSVGLCMGPPVKQAKLTDKGVELNLDGSSLYERFMDLYRDLGFPAPVVQLSDSGQAFAAKHELGSPGYVRAYKGFWVAMQAECRKRGWPEIIVQPVDEPGWQSRAHKDRNVALLKLLKQIPGMRTEQDGPGDAYFHGEAGPFADVWNYNGAIAKPLVVADAQKKGHTVMLYNCDVESYRPEAARYVAGFFQKRAGTSGCYNWAYMSWHGSPYDDLDHRTGTWMHVYPPLGTEPGGPSTGWQGFREGIDDYKYIVTAERAIARASKSHRRKAIEAARRARSRLDALLASLDYSPRVRGTARWTVVRPSKQGKTISGTLKVPNGWTFADYDIARWQLADATVELMAALGEIREPRRPWAPTGVQHAGQLLAELTWSDVPEAAVQAPAATHQLSIPMLAAAPKIDGDIGDAVWKRAATIREFVRHTGKGKPTQQTHVWACADAGNLYVAFECLEDNIGHITAHVTEDGEDVWQDDCVEIFFDPRLDRANYRQIVVNSLGKQYWKASDDSRWRAKSVAAARKGDKAWTVELRIPLADLGLAQTTFGFNVCRERRPLESLELSCWSPTGGGFCAPERFGVASLGHAFVTDVRLGTGLLGWNALRVGVKNHLAKPARFAVELRWRQGRGDWRCVEIPSRMLRPGASQVLDSPYEIVSDQEPVELAVRLLDGASRKELWSYRTEQRVRPALTVAVKPATSFLTAAAGRVDITTGVTPEARRSALLRVSLRAAGAERASVEQAVAPLSGERLSARLDLRGLGAGEYTLRAALHSDRGSAEPLAVREMALVRLRGPFD